MREAHPSPVSDYALHERLPTDVVAGGALPWTRYRQYPVFSARWLLGRSLLFGAIIGTFALVSGFAMGFVSRDYGVGALVAAYSFAAFMLMAVAGPAFATWVRHRRWPLRRERIGVVMGVLMGIATSFFVDQWASSYIDRYVEAAMHGRQAAGDPTAIAAGRGRDASAQGRERLGDRLQAAPPLERALALTINVIVLVVIYGAFGGGLALRAYFGEQRRWEESRRRAQLAELDERKRSAELRLGVLQAQVEPHFLFNTLAAVRALLREQPAQAEATLDALVGYLRASIPRLREDAAAALDSTLGQQVDLCAHYLEVMRLRSGGRVGYEVRVPEALCGLAFPPLLLITLVENAVKHGIEPRPGRGRVTLEADASDDRLRVRVIDDGVGLAPDATSTGLGLANVREQLRARYGARAALRLQSNAPRGTLAEIELPLDPT